MRVFLKSIKTWLSRRRWFYRLLLRCRAWFYAVCEWLSLGISRLFGRPVLIGIDLLPTPESDREFRYEIAAALRFKNEAQYLAEWIDFHEAVGVDHFYLYNNNSGDDFREVLAPYLLSKLVTLHDWPEAPASPAADLHCITHYKDEAKWIAFIDADEFLFPVSEPDIKTILRRFETFPALSVNWIYFGSNGRLARPEGGVLENFTRRSAVPNRHVKSIVNPRRVIKYGNSHHWFYSRGALPVNTEAARVFGSFSEPAVADVLRINHYYSKSREEFMAKAAMKSWVDKEGARFPSRTMDAWNRVASVNNDVEDASASRFLPSFKPNREAAR
jgi:hypothetical protein